MKKMIQNAQGFLEKYNFLWILYLLFTVFVQLGAIVRIIPLISHLSVFNVWDLVLAPLYVGSLGVFVFKKKLFTPTVWKIIFGIILLDLFVTFWRGIHGDTFIMSLPCQPGQGSCTFTFLSTFITSIAKVVPLYYVLALLSFPKFSFTFTSYPTLTIKLNTKPKRFFAFPIVGMLAKLVILIPVFFDLGNFFCCISFSPYQSIRCSFQRKNVEASI